MDNRIQMLGALAVGLAVGAGLGHALATRSPGAPGRGSPRSAHDAAEARRAIEELVHSPASTESAERLAQLLAQLGAEATSAIPPLILDPGQTIDAPYVLLLLQFWIDRDAKGAAEWISKSAPLGYRMFALDAAVERVAASDPKDALRYVGSGHRADTRLLKPLIRGWVRSGQPGVEDWIRDLDYGFKRQKALGAYARARIAHDGAAAAIAWLEGLPDTEDGFKGEAFLRMTSELTYADPAAGVAWYEKHRDGPYGAGLMTTVADAWAGVDGPAAMHWVSQQPPGKERDDAVLDGIRSWGIVDVQGMKRWARNAERLDDWFQPGLPILSRLLAADDPAEGIRYAERITDEERRHLTLLQIARQWHASDPAAAEAWLAQSQLTEEERERALQVSTPGGRKPAAPAPAAP